LDKFKNRIAASGPEYTAGVQNPKASWSGSYKASADRMQAELLAALQRGDHIKGVDQVGDAGWQAAAQSKGAPRFTAAAGIAADAYAKKVDQVLAAGEAAAAAASALPNTTLEQRIQRSAAAQMAIHNSWGKGH